MLKSFGEQHIAEEVHFAMSVFFFQYRAALLQSKEHCMECMRFISSGRHCTWQIETVWLYLTGNFKGGEHNRCYAIFVNIYFSIYTSFHMHGLHDSSTEQLNVSTSPPVCTCFHFEYFGLRRDHASFFLCTS